MGVASFNRLHDRSLGMLRLDESWLMGVWSGILLAIVIPFRQHGLQFLNFLTELPEVILHSHQNLQILEPGPSHDIALHLGMFVTSAPKQCINYQIQAKASCTQAAS